jgi:hypothetical protein
MPAGKAYTIDQLYALARKAGFSVTGAIKAAMVAMAESSGIPTATSSNPDGGTNVGIMQLDTRGVGSGHTVKELQDPLLNMQIAQHASRDGTNWSQWATWPDAAGKYASQAQAAAAKDTGSSSWLDGILKDIEGVGSGLLGGAESAAGTAVGALGQVLSLPDQITGLFSALEKPVQAAAWFVNPVNWARLVAGGMGLLLLVAGLVTLGMAA